MGTDERLHRRDRTPVSIAVAGGDDMTFALLRLCVSAVILAAALAMGIHGV